MKEQIIFLEPHDDFYSARDKMGWTQTARLLMVWPPGERVLTRRLDLELLRRHAGRLGAQLAVISDDVEVREHAQEVGVPAFDTLEASRRQRWRTRLAPSLPTPPRRLSTAERQALRPPAPWLDWSLLPPGLSLTLRWFFFLLGLSAPLMLAYALAPAATVTVTAATWPREAIVTITADPTLTQSEPPDHVPARRLQIEVEASDFTPATGQVEVPDQFASGEVVFTNLSGAPAVLPQGLGVRTSAGSPTRFVTTAAATIEGRLYASVVVPIRAVIAGPAGNVPAGQINAIDGPLGLQLAVTNPTPTAGGTLRVTTAVTAADRARLRLQLIAQLRRTAVSRLESQLQPGEFLIAEAVTVHHVVSEAYDLAAGEAGEAVWLTLRLAIEGLAVNEREALQLAQGALEAQVPPDQRLLPASVHFSRQPEITLDDHGRAHFTVSATGISAAQIDPAMVRQLVRNLPPSVACERLLANLPLADTPAISVIPHWYGRLPWLDFRLTVVIQ